MWSARQTENLEIVVRFNYFPSHFDSESEGVLMIITSYGLIVFQLVIWIGVTFSKSSEAAKRKYGVDLLGFAYPAIPTRHEVCIEPNLREDNNVYD